MIKTHKLSYFDPETGDEFEGVICSDTSIQGKKPGVLIAHAFGGQGEFDVNKAQELAKLGYVGFAIDMYGKGKRASNPQEAGTLMKVLNDDRSLLLRRILLALVILKEQEEVDTDKIGAIGFCFGGKCVLDLARSGVDIRGVVTFHGVPDKPKDKVDKPILASILLLHGWDDPLATPDKMIALTQELTNCNADWQLHAFGHTGHAFTNPKANSPQTGSFYMESSDKRSWQAMVNFFEEVFSKN